MEIAEKEIVCMEIDIVEYVGPTACIEPPKRPTQTAGHATPSDVLCFAND